jgi:YHS domain-containing protein
MLVTVAGLAAMIMLGGCKKKAPPAEPKKTITAAIKVEQTICPVMEGAINKAIFTEYKGKKVYFCCAGCKTIFEKEPEKYLSKLPQFQN